jgi:tetratricopeptide (TPR) repeat protein
MNWLEKVKEKLGGGQGSVGRVEDERSERRGTGTVLREPREHGSAANATEATRTAEADWVPGQQLLDDFVVEGALGEGGMGKVYLLRSRSTGSRFAVKRAKGLGEADRRDFLAELQTWIDLPEHANLVPCRFFRTVGDEVLIFAEYVEGGSLEEWIHSGKLYEGGTAEALERMLDVAIQFAWGLHCLHELGLVHQDVKPGNMLMGGDGKTAVQGVKPRVTDYGLARARAAAGGGAARGNVLVSTGGGTPAYWSPEQAAGWKLTDKTDIWSWGLSVLEMFTGEVRWTSGLMAAEELEKLGRQGVQQKTIPIMTAGLAELLRECFREEPCERLASMGEAVDRLKAIYQEAVGTAYGRTLRVIERGESLRAGIEERRVAMGAKWTDPRQWLEKGLRAAGRNSAEAARIVAGRGVTRQGELVGDIAVYDEAKRLYVRLVQEGRKELENDLATLCVDKALVHMTAADVPGAMGEYDQAIAIRERLIKQEGRRELADDLASVYMNKALAASALGDHRGSVALYDQAIAIWERLVNQEGRRELANRLATAYMNKAIAVSDVGDKRGAVALYDQAIAIRERLVNQEGRRELANELANAYLNKATAVRALGDNRGAVALLDQAIAIWERLVNQEGRRELANELANAYLNKAAAFQGLGDNRGAVALLDQAIAIWERLVNQEGRRELANGLAKAYMNKANAVSALGDNCGAVALHDQAIAIYERLVNQEGRRELANDLANAYMNKAIAVSDVGDKRGAVALYDQAIAIRERLVNQEGRRELANDLALAYTNKAVAVGTYGLGDNRAALALSDQAIAIRERLVHQEGRRELAHDLATGYLNKAIAVSALGDNRGAVTAYDRAIAIWERLVNQEGRRELSAKLGAAKCGCGEIRIALGEKEKGLQYMRSAEKLMEAEIGRTDDPAPKQLLMWLQERLKAHSA